MFTCKVSREVPNKKDTVNMDNDTESNQTHYDHHTSRVFFVIFQTCVFSSLATTKNDTYSYCIFV